VCKKMVIEGEKPGMVTVLQVRRPDNGRGGEPKNNCLKREGKNKSIFWLKKVKGPANGRKAGVKREGGGIAKGEPCFKGGEIKSFLGAKNQ